MSKQATAMIENDNTPLWSPNGNGDKQALLSQFMEQISGKTGETFSDYGSLWRWSVEHSDKFWSEYWDFADIIGDKGSQIIRDSEKMPGACFFPEAKINYAENLLRRRDDAPAIISRKENGEERVISFLELYEIVSLWVQAFKAAGVKKGDRIAGYMPNIAETIIATLASSAIGAIWSSASPDFGVHGVLDRFGQIEPKILIGVDGYLYNGKSCDCLEKIKQASAELPSVEKVIIVPFLNERPEFEIDNAVTSEEFVSEFKSEEIDFYRTDFNAPLFIMFSSGTTGVPKCIVHGQGGTLIQQMKEHQLHCDVNAGDRVFYFTTCGWMMWNWLICGLACNATLLLYDGSPFYPDGNVLWEYTSKHKCTLFGTAAKYIDALKSQEMKPKDNYDLSSIRTITSTGSPLVHESFEYVYESIKQDVHLASISGGTDIISCFVLGNPISSVWRGEIQGAGLGMAVNVFDSDGAPIDAGAGSGELVCTKPFPSMPVMFWNDPDGEKYHSAYFNKYENVWCHGDWIERTDKDGFIIHGRSDATLNPGGVRIGTSEIYRVVEQFKDVQESIAVGQDWENDVRVILFVVLKPGCELTEQLKTELKSAIRHGASPRHCPAKIISVSDIPRTKSNKITEIAVRDVIHGRPIKNQEALANPEALSLYEGLAELKEK